MSTDKFSLYRNIFILLAGLALLGLLAACQPQTSAATAATPAAIASSRTPTPAPTSPLNITPAPAQSAPAQPHLQVDPKALEKLQIQFWHPWSGKTAETVRSIVTEFNETNEWRISVVINAAGSSAMLQEQVETSLGTAQQPHVVAAPIEQLLTWRENARAVLALDDFIEDSQWGFTAQEAASFPRVFWQQDRLDERQLGIPAQRSTVVMFYNQSWARSLGFSAPPATLEEFRTQACAAAAQNGKGTGGWIVNTDPITLVSWMLAFQVNQPAKIGTPEYKFNNSAVNEMFLYLRQLYDDGCAWISRNPTPYEYFSDRQALFYTSWLQDIPVQARTNQRLESEDQWTVIPFPSKGQKPPVVASGPSFAVLVASPEEQLASWLLIKWLVQPENLARLVEADGAWPGTIAAVDLLTDFRDQYPQWNQSLGWIPLAEPAPRLPAWRIIRKIYQDVAWQIFRTDTKPEQIPTYLQQVDETIPEVLKSSP